MFGELALEMNDQEVCRQLISIVHTWVLEGKVDWKRVNEVLRRQDRPKLFWPLLRIVRFEVEVRGWRYSEMTLAGFIE